MIFGFLSRAQYNLGEPVSILEEDLEEVIFATGGELYEETGKLLPIGTLTFFKLKSGITYRNCATGKYYSGQTLKSCIGTVYTNPVASVANPKPIIVRPCHRNGNMALNIVALESYDPPLEEVGYDYLLPYFFSSTFDPQGILFQASNSTPYFDLSEEFSDPNYKALIQQYPNLAEYHQPSSFYINGAALILKHYQESYNYCATEQMVENLLKIISIPNLAIPNPGSPINNTVPADFYENITANTSPDTGAFVDDLFSQLKNSPSFLAQSGNPALDQLIQLFMHRNELLQQYQAIIDNASEGDLSDFITFFKNTFFQLEPCEVDRLNFSYPKIKTLIEAVLTDNWFWVSNRDERLILKLIDQVPPENHYDFLTYLESKRLPVSNDWLWMELIKRVDNSWFDENGKKLVQQLAKIWKLVAQANLPENIFKKRVEDLLEEIDQCDQESIDTFDQEKLTAASRQVVPYHYRGVINRLMDISSAGWLIPNVASLVTDVQVNETTGQLDIHQNLKLFVIKAGSDLLPPRYGCQPFTPLILDKHSTYGLAKTLSAEGFTIVPAFIFYFLERQARTQTTEDLVFTSIDIATLPIPFTTVHKVMRMGKTLFRFDKASSAASIAGTLSQEDFPKISKILNTTSALLGLTTLGAEGWLKMKSFRTNGTIRKILGEVSKAASDANLADRVQKLNILLTEIEALTPLQIALLKGKSNIPALSEVILKGGQELIDEGADISRQRINDAIRILNSDMLTFLRNQLESIGANAQLIERVTILEESKAIALTLDLMNAGPDFLRAFNLDAVGGLVRAWEVVREYDLGTNLPLLKQVDDLIRNDGIFIQQEFSNILYYGTTGDSEDIIAIVKGITAFKKYNSLPGGNSILRNLIIDTETDLSRQIIEVANRVDNHKGLSANQLLEEFENFSTHLGQHTSLRESLYTNPSLYDDWYFPHRDMFEIPELGEQTIYCRQNNIGESYPNLSNENIAPIRYYTSPNGHETLNSGLANNNLSHKLSNYANRLETSLNNCDKFYGKLYRGLPFNVDANWVNTRYTIGEEATELTFLSTSTDKGVAKGFTENLMYEINAIGNKGADIRSFSLSLEGEITYLSGTKFRVDDIKTPTENNGIWLIKMTEIQEN